MKPIIKVAFSYMVYYKKQTLAILLTIICSVALLSGIGSLVYSGYRSQLENKREINGDWHYYIKGNNNALKHIKKNMVGKGYKIEKVAIEEKKKIIDEPYVITMIYGDETYRDMMGYKLKEGYYPKNENEIAFDEYSFLNIIPEGKVGSVVELDGIKYTITGILEKRTCTDYSDMKAFVSKSTKGDKNSKKIYIKFQENKKLYYQIEEFQKFMNIKNSEVYVNCDVSNLVGAKSVKEIPALIREGLSIPDGKFGYIWGKLNESYHLTENLTKAILAIFSAFIIYSVFNTSIWKRISQYGILQSLGVDEEKIASILLVEILFVFCLGFPLGIIIGNIFGKIFYSKFAFVFTGNGISSVGFFIDKKVIIFALIFLLSFFIVMCVHLMKKLREMTLVEKLHKDIKKKKKSRKIYSLKKSNMTTVLTNKFMFKDRGTFIGILISLALGGLIFIATNFVIVNTEKNNDITMKADDGLNSDVEVYMESNDLSQVISEDKRKEIAKSGLFGDVYGVKYLLGEVPFMNREWTWDEYYDETAIKKDPSRKKTIDPVIMKLYNGRITDEGNENYKIKSNIYGYDDGMLLNLKDYLLEGDINIDDMKKNNTIVLKTMMDGQGYYGGLKVKVGDTIILKVPKSQYADKEVLRFQASNDQYIEKKFVIGAIVSRCLGKNDYFIGEEGSLGIIFTNKQMKDNFGVSGYTSLNLQLKDRNLNKEVKKTLKNITKGIDRCIVKDYITEIDKQNDLLQQKMAFFYGVSLLILIISMVHIINTMNYIVISRRHEFGILRAMGVTDSGFMKMMIIEGIRYGIYASILTLFAFIFVRKAILYFLQHVYLYIYSSGNVSFYIIAVVLMTNIFIGVLAICIPARRILKDKIKEEINYR